MSGPTQNEDQPADAPLGPIGLPEDPAKANTDQSSPKDGKQNEVKPQCKESADHHREVVFSHDDSAGHHNINVGPFRHDDSTGRSQRAKEFRSQENQTTTNSTRETYPKADIKAAKSSSIRTSNLNSTTTDHAGRSSNFLLKYATHQLLKSSNGKCLQAQIQKLKQIGRTIDQNFAKILEPATTLRSLNMPIQSSKFVSIKRSTGDELSATSLAPNSSVNRRKTKELGQRYSRSKLSSELSTTPDLIPLLYTSSRPPKRRRIGVRLSSNLMLAKRRRIYYTHPASNMVYSKRHRIAYSQPASTWVTQNNIVSSHAHDNPLNHTRVSSGHPDLTQI
ncbi:hypothetical protein F511_29293 [Dorcoceras hygrometricum]|uniref:Uncharacterized protein n=1 Tax=Dorcoceras hygrometricum TaxID=472368 RepID=A0A2Z7BCB0_9LAMI|nr:hypothetical protein F511_29293 [Dorcoceras hygrometricum]